ncbi:MAG: radical SAM protein [Anaerolineaceae bacterium]
MTATVPATLTSPEKATGLTIFVSAANKIGPRIVRFRPLMKAVMALVDRWFLRENKKRHIRDRVTPPGVIDDETAMSLAIVNTFRRLLTERQLSPSTFQMASSILAKDLFVMKSHLVERSVEFRAKFGFDIPSFLLISPTKACNLRCIGCYADADEQVRSLDWDVVDRLVGEMRTLWGAQFLVISGGEPLAYRSQGKTILDLAAMHRDVYFMFYTNGTLITRELAQQMSELGNLIPMISLEGWRERTDARRGAGVFDKAMAAMDALYDSGVIYGASLTAMHNNAEEILSDEFVDFLFIQKHISIAWLFEYLPIGRAYTLEYMVTPQQRLWMWQQSWKFVRSKRYFMADFWNHGTAVDGCLSAGGHGRGGYLYIEWNGNVTPCVFVPYSPVNIKDVYARGGNLNDIFCEPFFADLRRWQMQIKKDTGGSNLLNPCPIRDHNADLRQLIRKHEAEPIDPNSAAALQDAHYSEGMDRYDAEYQKIVDRLWETAYLRPSSPQSAEVIDLVEAELVKGDSKDR